MNGQRHSNIDRPIKAFPDSEINYQKNQRDSSSGKSIPNAKNIEQKAKKVCMDNIGDNMENILTAFLCQILFKI